MPSRSRPRVAVVGSGPNGLAAAVTLARAGLEVDVLERNAWAGGGASTREITLPGFRHDLASAVHPMALASPFFTAFELGRRVELLTPEISFAHPLSPGRHGIGWRDLDRAAESIGRDGAAYRRLLQPLVERLNGVADLTTSPLLRVPRHPVDAVRFGISVLDQGTALWHRRFEEEVAPAMVTGTAAHTIGRHPRPAMAGAGLVLLALAHAKGWPLPRGGSQSIADAMIDDVVAHGGRVHTEVEVADLAQLSSYDACVLDVGAHAFASIAGERLPAGYLRALRSQRRGNGVAKTDLALSGPVPWLDADLAATPTIHLGGTREQIAAAEAEVARGRLPERPYVLLVQPGVVDGTRAPSGQHTLWAYTHVPYDCPVDRTEIMLSMLEEHAPGIRDLVIGCAATPADRFADTVSANFSGGDFATGAVTLAQMVRRPVLSPRPWRTPLDGVYLASGTTSPGPSVHGMAGWHAARLLLRERYGDTGGGPALGPGA